MKKTLLFFLCYCSFTSTMGTKDPIWQTSLRNPKRVKTAHLYNTVERSVLYNKAEKEIKRLRKHNPSDPYITELEKWQREIVLSKFGKYYLD